MILFFVSTLFYPGGSQNNINTVGYDWQHNYISNLFAWTAINGQASNSPIWAAGGMFVLSYSFSLFFIRFSQKIPVESASLVIKYFGVAAMFFVFLAVTPYHDTMLMIAETVGLVSLFYCTAFIFKTRFIGVKMLSVLLLMSIYASMYLYYSRSFIEILPVAQKSSLVLNIIWVLILDYKISTEDFNLIKISRKE